MTYPHQSLYHPWINASLIGNLFIDTYNSLYLLMDYYQDRWIISAYLESNIYVTE